MAEEELSIFFAFIPVFDALVGFERARSTFPFPLKSSRYSYTASFDNFVNARLDTNTGYISLIQQAYSCPEFSSNNLRCDSFIKFK
jgi:hypothetical protein